MKQFTKEELALMNDEELFEHAKEYIESIIKEQVTPEEKLETRLEIDSILTECIATKLKETQNE